MAEIIENKEINKETEANIKPIVLRFKDTGTSYTLEFNRNVVAWAEDRGFPLNIINSAEIMREKPVSVIEDLFFYSFQMHHRGMSKAMTDKILYEDLGGLTSEMLERLISLHALGYSTLINTEDKPKNPNLAVEL